jgi:hypothetical protein
LVPSLLTRTVTYEVAWVFERKASRKKGWELSVVFPLSSTYSALEFYVAEVRRIRAQRLGFEAMRLIMVAGGKWINVAGIVAGPSSGRKKANTR